MGEVKSGVKEYIYCRKSKIKRTYARNMFLRSNMAYCLSTVWLNYRQVESIIMYTKFMIEDKKCFLSRSIMDFCMAEIKSERVNEYL